jgi:hypothetical protein
MRRGEKSGKKIRAEVVFLDNVNEKGKEQWKEGKNRGGILEQCE